MTIIETIKELKPRETLAKKDYKQFYTDLEDIHKALYNVYLAREKGTSTSESESKVMTQVTEFLHTLGKANGKYISVCEKTTENGITTVLFDTLVYNSFTDRIYTKSEKLAKLECEKSKANKNRAKAHKDLLSGKGSAKAYKESIAKVKEITEQIETERDIKGSEDKQTVRKSSNQFAKFTIARLQQIALNRYALTEEEIVAMRKERNKATKENRAKNK